MADSPASGQWLDCLNENSEPVSGSETLLQSGMMSFQTAQVNESDVNGQTLPVKTQKDITDMSLMATTSFAMFSSDSDASDTGEMQLPNLSLGEASLEDGLAKSEPSVAAVQDTSEEITDVTKLVGQITMEHAYNRSLDGKQNTDYHCPFRDCTEVVGSQEQMTEHVKKQHSDTEPTDGEDDVELKPDNKDTTPGGAIIEYKCTNQDCSFTCTSCEKLAEHIKFHDSGQLHKCTIHNCTETFHTLADLREHMYSHRDKRIFTCRICEQSFQFSYQLRKHMELHDEDDDDEQDAELKSGTSESEDGKPHNDTSKDTDPEDGKISDQGEGLQFVCHQEECGEAFPSRYLLKKHLATHDNLLPHKCTTCGRTFQFAFLLNRHKKTHNGLVCSHNNCHKSFDNAKELQAHMKTHDVEKVRRPRGRPRKKPLVENAEGSPGKSPSPEKPQKQQDASPVVPGQKRPVGRPRKIRPPEQVEQSAEKQVEKRVEQTPEVKPKRPRGRPRRIKPAETDTKPTSPVPETTPIKAAASPPSENEASWSSGTMSTTPTRCSARSTKGQWRSAGSKTNMGGVGLLTVIKQERTKSRKSSTSDAKSDREDGLPIKEQVKMIRKRSSSADEGSESPKAKAPKKVTQASPDHSAPEDDSASKEMDTTEKLDIQSESKQPAGEIVRTSPASMPPKKVICITTAKPVVTAVHRGRTLGSVLKVGHATREAKKVTTSVNTQSSEAQKKALQGEKGVVSGVSDEASTETENTPEIQNSQDDTVRNKKLQRNKVSSIRTMSTRQSRGLTCVIPFCTSYQLNKGQGHTNIHFIKFPEQQADINKWIKILKLPKDFEVKPSTRICHLHFNKADLEVTSDGTWQCQAGAAPRIFNAK